MTLEEFKKIYPGYIVLKNGVQMKADPEMAYRALLAKGKLDGYTGTSNKGSGKEDKKGTIRSRFSGKRKGGKFGSDSKREAKSLDEGES